MMTHTILSFDVLGTPQSQGSIRAFIPKGWKRPILTSTNKELKPWRQEVASNAHTAMMESCIEGCIEGPVRVEALFYFCRPKSRKKERHKTTAPDIDKLARALLDAMAGTVYMNDAQVSQLWVSKFFDNRARTAVRVSTIEEP
jgi:Holliday junction resolvase RusA-like endonuclease